MCYDVPNKNHLKSHFLVFFFKMVVFRANSCLYRFVYFLFLKMYTLQSYMNNNEDMAIWNSICTHFLSYGSSTLKLCIDTLVFWSNFQMYRISFTHIKLLLSPDENVHIIIRSVKGQRFIRLSIKFLNTNIIIYSWSIPPPGEIAHFHRNIATWSFPILKSFSATATCILILALSTMLTE